MVEKKKVVMFGLINKLSEENCFEANQNAQTIMWNLLKVRECFDFAVNPMSIAKVAEHAFNPNGNSDSRCAALTVLWKIAQEMADKGKS